MTKTEQHAVEKRFSDAELSAEVFRAAAWLGALGRSYAQENRNILFEPAFGYGPVTRDEYEYATMNRFLREPHYDEEQVDGN